MLNRWSNPKEWCGSNSPILGRRGLISNVPRVLRLRVCLSHQVFKYFDIGETGRIDYNQFFAAMTRLNFVGVQVRACVHDVYS